MAIFKGKDKLTISSEGAIILLPNDQQHRKKYFKDQFHLSDKPTSVKLEDGVPETTGITANDKYRPKQEDLLRVPFRMLSETIVAGSTWRATDFSKKGVLKRSIGLLVGKPAYTDHMQWGDMFLGAVVATSYQGKTTDSKGQPVPAGMNGVFQIDAAQNEKLARGLLSTPPSIHSCSVSVAFNWEASHDFESEDDFYRHIGEMIEGSMVRRIVTEIIDYFECSIVWMGADPYAKMLDESGKPMFVDRGSTFDETSKQVKDLYEKKHEMFARFSYRKNGLYLEAERGDNPPKSDENTSDMEELFKLIREALGLAEDAEITNEHLAQVKLSTKDGKLSAEKRSDDESTVEDLQKQITEKDKKIETLTAENTDEKLKTVRELNSELTKNNNDLQADNDRLTLEATKNSEAIELGKQYIEDKRKEAIRLYKAAAGEDADESVVGLFQKADSKELDGLIKSHLKDATGKFQGKCADCGSDNFTFQSSLSDDNGSGEGDAVTSDEQVHERFLADSE